jgi:hypothetical protein
MPNFDGASLFTSQQTEMLQQRPLIGYEAVPDLFNGQATIRRPMKDFLFGHIGEPKMNQIFSNHLGTIENLSRVNGIVVTDFL